MTRRPRGTDGPQQATVRITVFGRAEPSGSKRARGRMVVDANPRVAQWKGDVARAAAEAMAGRPLLPGPLGMVLVVVRPRPAGHWGRRGLRPSAPAWPATRPDTVKLCRAVEDALAGVVYRDDAQICRHVIEKQWGEPARIEVSVRTLSASDEPLSI